MEGKPMQQHLPLQIFQYEQETKIRTATIDGEPWFYGTDVCQALEIVNTGNAYERLEKDDIRTTDGVDAKGRKSKVYIISEYGLYDLILQSRKEEAKKFKRWIIHDVIPQIRKTGSFSLNKTGGLPAFVRRFNDNWDRVDRGYVSIINEVFIRFYGRLEQVGHILPDKGFKGREIRPDVSVGKRFPKWMKKNYPLHQDKWKYYSHKINGRNIDARQYKVEVLPMIIEYLEDEWIPHCAYEYLQDKDAKALDYLPKLLPPPEK